MATEPLASPLAPPGPPVQGEDMPDGPGGGGGLFPRVGGGAHGGQGGGSRDVDAMSEVSLGDILSVRPVMTSADERQGPQGILML